MFLCIGICVLQLGDRLVADKHYASPEIKEVKERLNREWVDLNEKAADKGKKLRDASKQQMLNRALEDAQVKSQDIRIPLPSAIIIKLQQE